MRNRAAGRYRYSVKELVTLADIAPSWDRRLGRMPASRWSLRWLRWYSDIVSPENCIVGEAHGRSASYLDSCKECKEFSNRFPRYFKERAYGELEDDVQRFVVHWNEKHAGMVSKHRVIRWFDSFVRFDDYVRTYR